MQQKAILFFLSLFASISISAQTMVKGTVVDNEGLQLIGATVLVKGTTAGTVTDFEGNYEIEVPNKNDILIISYTGYVTSEIPVNGQSIVDVTMQTDVANLDEIIVVGYGTQKKKVVTAAISKVSADELEDMPVLRIEQSLLGRTSGVRVTTNSGQPGEGATLRIRGTTTIGNSEPLYVVDGVVVGGGIDYLNQSDIESIEVLKDAASAGIYGARAANGVVLITTKQGNTNQMELNYSGYYGLQAPWKKLALLNATEYATLMNESAVAAGGSILYDDPASLGEGTDWQDAVFSEDAPIQNHELSISAGNKVSKYYASFGYFDQEGIVARSRSQYKRFTARFNSTHKVKDFLTIGNNIGYTYIEAMGVSTNSEFGSPLSRALNLDPITPILETRPEVLGSNIFTNFPVVRNSEGIPYGISDIVTSEVLNPVAALAIENGFGWSHKIVGNFFAEAAFLDGFKLRSSIGSDLAFWGGEGFSPIFYLNATNRNDITNYRRDQNRGLYWIWTNTLTYEKRFGAHKINALVGVVGEQNAGRGQGGSIQNIPVDNFDDVSLSFPTPAETQTFGGFEYLSTTASYLARLNYNFNEKYLISAVFRRDGSSRFGSNNKFGNFPSLSVGWVASDENFLANNTVLNFLKVRASWGINGNDRIGDFLYASTVGGGRNYTFGTDDVLTNGVSPNALSNPDLRWEETTQINIGFDAQVFKKFSVTFDVFEKTTDDMLLGIAVPGYIGNGGPTGNIASLENRGVELEIGYSNKLGQVNLDLSGNISYIENEITDLGLDKEFLTGQTFSPQGLEITRTTIGFPIGHFYGFKTDGLFQNEAEVASYTGPDGSPIQPDAKPGDFRFVDVNGNGEIDPEDRTFIGDPTPTWTYGFNFTASYKGIDLVLFGQGVGGNDVFKATRRFDLQQANLTGDALGRWTGEGSTNSYPRLVQNDPNRNFSRSSDFYVENGAFFRIKTLQIGYTFPKSLMEKVGFQNVRFYVSGNNLLTLTQYSGFDPEIGGGSYGVDRGLYPQPRFYLLGVNATF